MQKPVETAPVRRILVVEDEALVAEEIQERLKRLGYDIIAIADTGEAAVEIAGNTKPDLVLMDIRLKGKMDGIEAGDRIYQSLNVPIVFVTAHSDLATLQRVKTNTTFGYVLKPFQERDLVMAIDMAMHRHSVEKHLAEQRLKLEDQLRQAHKMEAIGTLAGGIAHDFNNILSAIIGNVELARLDLEPNHPAHLSLGEIRTASVRARDLVKQILTFSRRLPQQRVPVDLRQVVGESIGMLRSALPAGVEITTSRLNEVPAVLADRTQMHQVLMNLCNNAWQAMKGKPGRIDIALDAVRLGEEAVSISPELHPGPCVMLSVTDNAGGMEAATADRVFDPFFTTKDVGEGTGLGLSVVHGIVQEHGGAIVMETRPGEGTVFKLYFPASDASPESQVEKPATTSRGQDQLILYLDDEVALVSLVKRTLERAGYKVDGYAVPEKALQAFKEDPQRYALALLDYNMPGASGLSVAGELLRQRPGMPIAITSGYVTEELRAEALALGIREVIYKPNLMQELRNVVYEWVNKQA